YKLDLKQWETDRKTNPDLQEPKPMDIVSELVQKLTDFSMGSSSDDLVVKLATGVAPADTNGKWDEKKREVVWETSVEEREKQHEFPTLCCATWSVPDEASQKKLFGRTLLSSKKLFEYCLWRQSLDSTEAKEWDQFLSNLTPDNFKTRLEMFRFSTEEKAK